MIKFIDLRGQIYEEICQFAFYDTIPDMFLTFDGSKQVFESWTEVEEYVEAESTLSRLKNLCPEWVFC